MNLGPMTKHTTKLNPLAKQKNEFTTLKKHTFTCNERTSKDFKNRNKGLQFDLRFTSKHQIKTLAQILITLTKQFQSIQI